MYFYAGNDIESMFYSQNLNERKRPLAEKLYEIPYWTKKAYVNTNTIGFRLSREGATNGPSEGRANASFRRIRRSISFAGANAERPHPQGGPALRLGESR